MDRRLQNLVRQMTDGTQHNNFIKYKFHIETHQNAEVPYDGKIL